MALVEASAGGDVVERYEYTPHGQRRVYRSGGDNDPLALNPRLISDRFVVSGSGVAQPYGLNEVGHQGLFHDDLDGGAGIGGLIHNRARILHAGLGRFMQRDPLGYVDGMHLYAGYHVMHGGVDPWGLSDDDFILGDLLHVGDAPDPIVGWGGIGELHFAFGGGPRVNPFTWLYRKFCPNKQQVRDTSIGVGNSIGAQLKENAYIGTYFLEFLYVQPGGLSAARDYLYSLNDDLGVALLGAPTDPELAANAESATTATVYVAGTVTGGIGLVKGAVSIGKKLVRKIPWRWGRRPATVSPTTGPKGGSYEDVRQNNTGGEVHHTPAQSVSPYTRAEGPSVWMETTDHRLTASWGNSKAAQAYRQRQADLIAQGRLREAIQMDIDDIRSRFGSKYDQHIRQMLDAFGFSE